MKPLPRVLVIGAGMSGLVAARILKDTGFAVEVVEARKRLGGRIWTDTSLGVPCDMGASWIHGARHNPLTVWCRSLGVNTVRVPAGKTWFFKEGKSYPLSRALWIARRGITRAAYAYIRASLPLWCQKIIGQDPKDIAIASVLDPVCEDPVLRENDRRMLWWILGLVEAISGAPAQELGILEWDLTESWQTNVAPLEGFIRLIEDAAKGLEIHLDMAVQKIIYDTEGVKLITSDGILSGDLAVVTLPIGVLRSGDIAFEPRLDPRKRQAIESIGFGGVLNKIVFRFPRRFWPSGHEKLAALPKDHQQRGIFPVWTDFSSTVKSPLLVGYASGALAAYLDRRRSDEEICERALHILKEMFSPAVPLTEGYVITRWLSDTWARGSYSYGGVGHNAEERRQLAQPIADHLFFAGEATHEEHYGTVHGALLSGQREAIRIHRRFCCAHQSLLHLPWQ